MRLGTVLVGASWPLDSSFLPVRGWEEINASSTDPLLSGGMSARLRESGIWPVEATGLEDLARGLKRKG